MNTNRRVRRSRRRGSVLIYSTILLVVFLGMVSLGMDYAHCQSVKTELQRSADLTARGMLQMYTTWTPSTAANPMYQGELVAANGVDGKYAAASYTITPGTWNASNSPPFTPGTWAGQVTAVKVVLSRTAAAGNPVKLIFPLLTANGRYPVKTSVDISATAVAYYTTTTNATVGGQSDPWLAGVTNGASVSDYDTAPNQSPVMVTEVTPGDTITFSNVTANNGGVSHYAGQPTPDGPNGDATGGDWSTSNPGGNVHSHNDDDPLGEPAVQNNIGNIVAPIDSLIGVFLKNTEPNSNPAPTSTLDYSTQSARDTVNNNTIQNQQPFFIGTGVTSTGTTKTFTVPPGCTRLFLGIMDGHQWSNNAGSFGVTINHGAQIKLVQ